jgi:broad specificity phosphatase PhoE
LEPALVHVCRHGEVYNPDGVLYTRLPGFHLSENGRAMAGLLAEHFAGVEAAYLGWSPVERSPESMAPIAAARPDVPVDIDFRLIEADSLMQGQPLNRRRLAILSPRNWKLFRAPWLPSWGEPNTHQAARMMLAIGDAAFRVGPGGQAILVSHQSPIWVARLCAEGRPLAHLPGQRHCALASVTTFAVSPSGEVAFAGYDEPARALLRR